MHGSVYGGRIEMTTLTTMQFTQQLFFRIRLQYLTTPKCEATPDDSVKTSVVTYPYAPTESLTEGPARFPGALSQRNCGSAQNERVYEP